MHAASDGVQGLCLQDAGRARDMSGVDERPLVVTVAEHEYLSRHAKSSWGRQIRRLVNGAVGAFTRRLRKSDRVGCYCFDSAGVTTTVPLGPMPVICTIASSSLAPS